MHQLRDADANSHAQTAETLQQKARLLAPVLRERAAATAQARRIPDETIRDFWDAGLWYLMKPKKFAAQQPSPAERSQRTQLTADDIAAFTDARIAAIKVALKLTPAQEKNWPAVEQAVRDISKERIARREARSAAGHSTDAIERLRDRADALTTRAAELRRLADAEKPLYQSLDEAQKRRFGMAFRLAAAHTHGGHAR